MSKLAVVIVNWNSWDMLSRCLQKLGEQTYRDFDVLVIDNASDAPAPDGFAHGNVALIGNPTNLGFAAANNQAIRLLDAAEWMVLLNPDAFPEPDWLEKLVAAARENPDYEMFASRQLKSGDLRYLDGDGDVYHMSGLVWREGYGRPVSGAAREPREVFSPCAAAAMYRRDALVAAGGFDERFFCYVEDVDLGFRLRLMGCRCLLVPDAVVHHVGSATTGGKHSDFALYHGHRNLVWTFVKNMPGWLFWALLPMHVALNLATIVWFSMRGYGGVICRAKLDAVKGLPAMWRSRREIQANRKAGIGEIWRILS